MILENIYKIQKDLGSREIKLFCADAMLMFLIIPWLLLGQSNDMSKKTLKTNRGAEKPMEPKSPDLTVIP